MSRPTRPSHGRGAREAEPVRATPQCGGCYSSGEGQAAHTSPSRWGCARRSHSGKWRGSSRGELTPHPALRLGTHPRDTNVCTDTAHRGPRPPSRGQAEYNAVQPHGRRDLSTRPAIVWTALSGLTLVQRPVSEGHRLKDPADTTFSE